MHYSQVVKIFQGINLNVVLIGLLWQELTSRVFDLPIGWPERWVLGASIWLVYTADHMCDVYFNNKTEKWQQRHEFVKEHFNVFAIAFSVLFIRNVIVAYNYLDDRVFRYGLYLTGLWLVYAVWIARKYASLKPYFTGVLFCVGVQIFFWKDFYSIYNITYVVFWLVMLGLFLFNSLWVYRIENGSKPELSSRYSMIADGALILIAIGGIIFTAF